MNTATNTAGEALDLNKSRAEFEAEMRRLDIGPYALVRDESGDYVSEQTQAYWGGFQLAHRSLPVDTAGIKTWRERLLPGYEECDEREARDAEVAELRAALDRAGSAAPAGQQAETGCDGTGQASNDMPCLGCDNCPEFFSAKEAIAAGQQAEPMTIMRPWGESPIEARRPYDNSNLPGYLESDRDYLENNLGAAIWLLDNANRLYLAAPVSAAPAAAAGPSEPFGYYIVEGDDLPYPGAGFVRTLTEGRQYRSVTALYTAPLPTKQGAGEVDAWISVEDRLPDQECLAVYVTPNGKQRLIRAKYARQFQIEAEGDDCETEYNEDDDTFYIKAGWLECIDNWGEYSSCYVVEGVVTHWRPSPALPAMSATQAQPKDTTDTRRDA